METNLPLARIEKFAVHGVWPGIERIGYWLIPWTRFSIGCAEMREAILKSSLVKSPLKSIQSVVKRAESFSISRVWWQNTQSDTPQSGAEDEILPEVSNEYRHQSKIYRRIKGDNECDRSDGLTFKLALKKGSILNKSDEFKVGNICTKRSCFRWSWGCIQWCGSKFIFAFAWTRPHGSLSKSKKL